MAALLLGPERGGRPLSRGPLRECCAAYGGLRSPVAVVHDLLDEAHDLWHVLADPGQDVRREDLRATAARPGPFPCGRGPGAHAWGQRQPLAPPRPGTHGRAVGHSRSELPCLCGIPLPRTGAVWRKWNCRSPHCPAWRPATQRANPSLPPAAPAGERWSSPVTPRSSGPRQRVALRHPGLESEAPEAVTSGPLREPHAPVCGSAQGPHGLEGGRLGGAVCPEPRLSHVEGRAGVLRTHDRRWQVVGRRAEPPPWREASRPASPSEETAPRPTRDRATSVELCAVTVALRWGAGTSVGDTPKPRGGGPAVPPRGDLVLPAAELQWGRGRGDWQAVCGPRVGGGAREGERTHSGVRTHSGAAWGKDTQWGGTPGPRGRRRHLPEGVRISGPQDGHRFCPGTRP